MNKMTTAIEKKISSLLNEKQIMNNTSIPPAHSHGKKSSEIWSLKDHNFCSDNEVDDEDQDYLDSYSDDEEAYTFDNNTVMDNEGDDDEGSLHSDSDDDNTSHPEKNYNVLSEEDIKRHQEEDISEVSSVLSISAFEATILLHHYNWSISNLHDAWFADEEKVRTAVGLLEKPVIQYPNAKKLTCGICFDDYRRNRMHTAACGHLFCSSCWNSYISTSINDGPGCLMLRCPDPSCSAAVGQEMVNVLVSDKAKEKYARYLLRSYVEASKKSKWCPAPGCGHAVEYVLGSGSYEVSCKCTHSFCWNCTEEAHRPVECEIVAKWISKNSAESENTTWILANSKPCPKCKRPIEKRDGCMHMTCTPPCSFQFCWLCLGKWSDHGGKTGGFYACNRYEIARKEGKYDQTEKRREMAKRSLKRYTHYYERWAANEKSRVKAMNDLQEMQTVHVEKLSINYGQSEPQFKFITEAWLQIIKCRRVLKWTYAYGYYLPEHEETKMQFFEYLQGEAESGLERLHHCAEKDLKPFIEGKSQDNFNEFRRKLSGLTTVTRNFFENLVRALENGLADVDTVDACSKSGNSKASVAETTGRGEGTNSRSPQHHSWSCESCTYLNQESSTICQICYQHRGSWSCGLCTYLNNVSATICLMCNQQP